MRIQKNGVVLLCLAGLCSAATDSVDVYCFGGHNSIKGVYWKNSQIVQPTGVQRSITKMAFSGGSHYYICDIEAAGGIVKYWRNDTAVSLQSKPIAATNDIFVDSSRTIVAGWDRDSITQPGIACCWVNGQKQYLSNVYSSADAIAVSGEDVYIAGREDWCPCIWKNGAKMELPCAKSALGGPDTVSEVLWIGTRAGHPIVGGQDYMPVFDYLLPTAWIWADSTKTYLLDGKGASSIYQDPHHGLRPVSYCIDGNDIYGFGYSTSGYPYTSHIWKNGVTTQFIDSQIDTISVSAGEVFRGGIYLGGSYRKNGVNQLCYWVNGSAHDIEGADRTFGIAGIRVVDRIQTTIPKPALRCATQHMYIRCTRRGNLVSVRFDGILESPNRKLSVVNLAGRTIAEPDVFTSPSEVFDCTFIASVAGMHCVRLEDNGTVISERILIP